MTAEQRDALCEYVDGLREAGRRYDEIAGQLEGSVPEAVLEKLEDWHRKWKKRQWRDELKRQQETVPIGESDFASGGAGSEETMPAALEAEREVVRYLAERLLGHEIFDGGGKVRWKTLYTRSLSEGQTCESVKGRGQAAGTRWLRSAVIFRTGTRIDHVEAEARIRERIRPDSAKARQLGFKREAVFLQKLHLVRERLDQTEICAKLAALLQTYLGRASGIKSGAHLARLTDRTRQAVSARKLLIAEDYYARTGGKAGFEGLTSAARHREKVAAKAQSETDQCHE